MSNMKSNVPAATERKLHIPDLAANEALYKLRHQLLRPAGMDEMIAREKRWKAEQAKLPRKGREMECEHCSGEYYIPATDDPKWLRKRIRKLKRRVARLEAEKAEGKE